MSAPTVTLVLGRAPESAAPSSHIMAGPWCLPPAVLAGTWPPPGQPDGTDSDAAETGGFELPPEPLADPAALELAARQARRLVAGVAPRLGEILNRKHGVTRTFRYWDTLLAPWLTRVAEALIDRLYRADDLLRRYGARRLSVPLAEAEDGPGVFSCTQDFIWRGVLDPTWNHWLLSRLLERDWPASWEKAPLPRYGASATDSTAAGSMATGSMATGSTAGGNAASQSRAGGVGGAARAARSIARRLATDALFSLPFPRVKGFATATSLRLSLALWRNRAVQDDTLPLHALGDPGREPLPLGWTEEDSLAFALALLPQSLREAPKRAGLRLTRTRVVSVAACEDDAYRRRVAAWREDGCRLIFIQHGGEYGWVRTSVAYPLVEYSQHRFITWGWIRHGAFAGRFLPLPHPQLAAVRGRHTPTPDAPLLLVGTEMALLPYTLKSMGRGRQFFAYRADKARFLGALPAHIRANSLYRPYFDVPCSLPDAPWLLTRFPEIRRCVGPLEPHLFHCRLLVLDHFGTTLAQALAAGVPTLVFRNPRLAPMTPEAEALLADLRAVGVVHDSPASAAAHVARIWDNVKAWWHAADTLAAVTAWARLHALTPDLLPPEQRRIPLSALWARSLRVV